MALTVDKLVNDDRFSGENVLQFILYLPFGIVLLATRVILALILWIASILLPNNQAVRQLLSTFACWTFGVYVKLKGSKDPRCSVLVANCVSCLDSLAVSHVLGTISLKKWKVPPFFASTLGIRNAAQFVRKQHFADGSSKSVLLQPEGGATNGKGLLKFTEWPFQIGNRVQPVTITVERPFTSVTVHRSCDTREQFPWSDALWFLWTPVTVFHVTALPSLERHDDNDAAFHQRIREAIAQGLGVEMTEYRWEELGQVSGPSRVRGAREARAVSAGSELSRLAAQVKEVLPSVPLADILRDLATTRSVDVTITNFLEGVTPYTPEPQPSVSRPRPISRPDHFPPDAKRRHQGFQDRKAQMIAEARQKYIKKHGLNIC
ncbi:unnamed protein product [Chilo suppressalis]|uniref:Lipid droplet-regulating VLDL assembly factor AUP1 n=1 Tax=Chilo suppressalis TaxID=168631 RepID=A0ABN8AU72_CHISP|nr:hypothetical protein evm_001161 [Chilo suppressalis]CAH0398586.1 unnamed protein product [Chilo suppressalis]